MRRRLACPIEESRPTTSTSNPTYQGFTFITGGCELSEAYCAAHQPRHWTAAEADTRLSLQMARERSTEESPAIAGVVARVPSKLARHVRSQLRVLARVVEWPIGWGLLSVVVPAIPSRAEELVDAEHEPVAVNALAAVDLEVAGSGH